MHSPHNLTAQHWIDIISNNELPAIASTARMLDKFNNDDKSSLPKLSKAILHDQALASCLLKVANSVQHLSVSKVSTVSRASVVLGIQAVKNICLTSRLVEGLLAKHDVDNQVFHQLTQSMASSFHAGLLAKMMAPQYAEDTREELYLAALLYRIGETAFWSSGGESAVNLVPFADEEPSVFELRCEKEIGTNFTLLSAELARTWNLSDLLIKALDQPESRTIEIQIIYLADKLSSMIANPHGSVGDFEQLLDDITDITGLTRRQLVANIEQVNKSATKLLKSYGASVLIKHIKHLPRSTDFNPINHQVLKYNPNKEKDLLSAYTQLTSLAAHSRDFSEFLQTSLIAMAKIFSFQRCSFFMLVDDKTTVESRYSCDISGEPLTQHVRFNLIRSKNIISHVIQTRKPALINDYKDKYWQQFITGELAEYIEQGAILVLPVNIGKTTIGIICAQVLIKNKHISDADQALCSAFVEHLNMCLTMLSHHH